MSRINWIAGAALCAALISGDALAEPAMDSFAQETTVDAGTADLVAQRLNDSLSREMFGNFNLFIYVDKAERGPFAQRMFVFQKTGANLALLYDWPVSTGRETLERDAHGHLQSSITPVGNYELDPKRLFENHVSSQWNEGMPYAMFFDWKVNGHDTGLAIHGAPGAEAGLLGKRASAGCVRVSEENAHTLFNLVQGDFRAPSPTIAYSDGSTNVSSQGFLVHAADGQLNLRDGYSVLVVVDDYVGNTQVSAAL